MPVPRPVRADMRIIRIAFLRASFAARSGAKGKPQPADGRSCALFHCTFRIISSDEFPVHAEAYSHENRKHKYEYGCKDVFLHHLPPSRFKLFGKAQTIAPRGMPALRPAWADMCVIRIAFLHAIFACPLFTCRLPSVFRLYHMTSRSNINKHHGNAVFVQPARSQSPMSASGQRSRCIVLLQYRPAIFVLKILITFQTNPVYPIQRDQPIPWIPLIR